MINTIIESCNTNSKGDEAKLKSLHALCIDLLHNYMTSLSALQKRCFKEAIAKDTSSTTAPKAASHFAKFADQVSVSVQYMRTLNELKPHIHLDRAFAVWTQYLKPLVLKCKNAQSATKFICFPKLIAAHYLLASEYMKAIKCLRDILEINEGDRTAYLSLLIWLCYIGEWELADHQISKYRWPVGEYFDHYSVVVDILAQMVLLNSGTLDKQKSAVDKLERYWNSPLITKKTFNSYQAQVLIRRALTMASNLPNADPKKTLDPVESSNLEANRLHSMVKNRYRTFYQLDESVDISNKANDPDEFLNLSSNMSEYFDVTMFKCRQLIDVGAIHDFETISYSLWVHSLRIGAYTRILSIGNLLLSCALLVKNARIDVKSIQQAVVSYLRPYDSSNDDKLLNGATAENDEESGVEAERGSNCAADPADFTEHSKKCDCCICYINKHNLQASLDIKCAKLLLANYSSDSFGLVLLRFRQLQIILSDELKELRRSMGFSIGTKAGASTRQMRESFLFVLIRWLRARGTVKKLETSDAIIKTCYKICCDNPLAHRQYWLIIRQMLRQPLPAIQYPWMLCSQKSFVDTAEDLSREFDAMSFRTPRRRALTDANQQSKIYEVPPNNLCSEFAKYGERNGSNISNALADFEEYGHLFYREWRYSICCYLAKIHFFSARYCWDAAFYIAEATCITSRQSLQSIAPNSSSIRYKSVMDFKNVVQKFSADLTVVQLFIDEEQILWLIRLHCDMLPLIVPVYSFKKGDVLLREFAELIVKNEESGKVCSETIGPKEFWNIRRELDKKLENLLTRIQNQWFDCFAALLIPHNTFSANANEVLSLLDSCGFSKVLSEAILESTFHLSEVKWQQLVRNFGYLDNISEKNVSKVFQSYFAWYAQGHSSFLIDMEPYTVLSLAPELSSVPFEIALDFDGSKICRVPSVHFIERLLNGMTKLPKYVDGKNSFYILDPAGDLAESQNRLTKMLQRYQCWKGTIGTAPNSKEWLDLLETNDLFFYMGHGSGSRYFGTGTVRGCCCRAVSVLMGCSSVRIKPEGEGFDGRGYVYDYNIANCPCLIGCLWMVTDGEIDRFFLAFLKHCFEYDEHPSISPEKRPTQRRLLDAIARARYSCKLRYLTGGAVVAYGLPVVANILGMLESKRE